MKILQVHNYYRNPGGEDEVFTSEVSALRGGGEEVITYTEENRRIDQMNNLSLAFQLIWSEPSRRRLLKVLSKECPDVVHFHNTFPIISPSAYYACKKLKIPVVQTLHNYRLLCPAAILFCKGKICEHCLHTIFPWPGVARACYRNSYLESAGVALMIAIHRWLKTWHKQINIYIALTKFARDKYIEGGLPAKKIVIKPNFIYSDPGMEGKNRSYVLFAGRLSQEKGISSLLQAWKELKGIPLKIAGDGLLRQQMQELVRAEKIENVEFLGNLIHTKVIDLMKKAYCLVLPSQWYECFSVNIIEAFACGTPVMAFPLGAMAELIKPGKNGNFFKSRDPKGIASAIQWAWMHPKEIEQMGKQARLDYENKYTAERNYKLLMEIYNKAIKVNSCNI